MHPRPSLAGASAAATLGAFLAHAALGQASFLPLGTAPRGDAFVDAVSTDGSVLAGSANLADPDPNNWDTWCWTGRGGIRTLPHPDTRGLIMYGLSADGSTVIGTLGAMCLDRCTQEAFRWTADGTRRLGFLPGGTGSWAYDVSADGRVVVGDSWALDSNGFYVWGRAFRWTAETGMVSLSDDETDAEVTSADGSVIAGEVETAAGHEAFRWTQASGVVPIGHLADGDYVQVEGISRDGLVVVGTSYSSDTASHMQAFRWTQASGMQSLGFPEGGTWGMRPKSTPDGAAVFANAIVGGHEELYRWTAARGAESLGTTPGMDHCLIGAVNGRGTSVAGTAVSNANDSRVAFIWRPQTGMMSLKDYLLSLGLPVGGWTFTGVGGVSDDGTILAGVGMDPAGLFEIFIATLPRDCGSADFDGDGVAGTDRDIAAFFACLAGNCCASCGSSDFDGDGDSATDADIEVFFRVLGGGSC
jgi:probable HAF family extracellular repeat protein